MRVRVLGDLEVVAGGGTVDLGGPKPRTLLALLVAAGGHPVPVEHLVDQIWGDEPPRRVEVSIQSYVARLRRALTEADEADGRPDRPQRLRTHAGSYSLDLADADVDVRRFEHLLREARELADGAPSAAEQALTRLEEALALWHGEAYAGATGPVLAAEAVRLGELRLGAVEALWALRIERGDDDAPAELEQLVRLHPLREQLWALLVRALYRASRQGDALAALSRAREHLDEHLGVEPGAELRRLQELVLRQDPSLDAPTPPPTATAEPTATTAPSLPDDAHLGLFGRSDELAAATDALDAASAGQGRVVVVLGEAGIGKTRLTEAITTVAAARGFRCGRGGWEPDPSPPLWGWSRAVEQALGRTDLLDVGAVVVDAASASFLLADALQAVLRTGPPTLLVLDDAHWADGESLRLLRRVATQVAALPVVLVVALRSTSADVSGAADEALAALARLDPVRLDLRGLEPEAVASWVAHAARVPVSGAAAALLVERTDGNPFHVSELVRLVAREGALGTPGAPSWRTVPGGVRDVVRHRLGRLDRQAVDVLETAAVLGRGFDPAVLAEVVGLDADTVGEALESALVLGLVEGLDDGRFRFNHALVRDAVYDRVPAPTRARRHAQAATVLEDRYAGTVLAHVSELAEHYRLAGSTHARSAWVLARRAGRSAAEASAHHEALRWYDQAGTLQGLDPTTTPVEREEVLRGQGAALVRLGRPLEAWPRLAAAAGSAFDRGEPAAAAEALLAITRDVVWGWRNAMSYDDDAIALWERALDELPAAASPVTRAMLQACLAVEMLYRPGGAARATPLADEAVHAVRRTACPGAQRLVVLRLAAQALLRPDLLHRRLPLWDEIVQLASDVGDRVAHAHALASRASDRVQLGRLPEARSDLVRAHDLARHHHLSQNLMTSGWALATWRHMEGDFAGAERAIADLEAFQATLAMAGEGIALCQLATVRLLQGRLPELEPVLRGASGHFALFREWHALSLVEDGRLDEARLVLGSWSEQPAAPWDYLWVVFAVVRSETWAALGDQDAIADLRAQLTPYADRLAAGSLAVSFLGSVQHTLGRLAAAAGDTEQARAHLQRARTVHADLGLATWVARTERALAALPAPV